MTIDWKKFTDPMLVHGLALMREITSMGHSAYIVGGSVRDLAMGASDIHDIDIATNMPIESIKSAWKTIEYGGGEKHGTVIVHYHGHDYELTQFRTEGTYSDARHPDSVEFVSSFEEDCKRRDFTINAMGVDCDGNVIDYNGGMDDIRSGVIRTVGSPYDRFTEDCLRILRAIRFACRFNFKLDVSVRDAICELKHTVTKTSPERIRDEILKMISCGGGSFYTALAFMRETELLDVILPDITTNFTVVRTCGADPVAILSLLLLGKSREDIAKFKEAFRLENDIEMGIWFVISNIGTYEKLASDSMSYMKKHDIITHRDFKSLQMAWCAIHKTSDDYLSDIIEKVRSLHPVLAKASKVSDALIEHGVKPSKEFGVLKNAIIEHMIHVFIESGYGILSDGIINDTEVWMITHEYLENIKWKSP